MNARSIRFRLAAWYAGLLSGVFLVLALAITWHISHDLKSSLGETQLRRARQIAVTLLSRVSETGESYVMEQIESVYAPVVNDRFIRIRRSDGTILYVSGGPRDGSFDPLQVPALSLAPGQEEISEQKVPGRPPLMLGACHFQAPDGNRFLVEVGASTGSILARLRQLRLELLSGLALLAGMAVGGGLVLVHLTLRPVHQLARKAEQITQQQLGERLPVARTGDELEHLALSLNRMISRLEDAVLNARRFGADAAHELRTPLTVMRGELESIAQDPRLHRQLRGPLGAVLEETERLAHTVAKLLTLARLDAGEALASQVQVDLAELAATTVEHMVLLAADKSIALSCEAPRPVLVLGDRLRLKQAVVNLVDNALKYTPEKGTVKVRVGTVNNRALLEVTDNGIGIPPEAQQRIFARFSRLDSARLQRDPGGTGLGLSIVKSICAAHGGEVRVQSAPGQGTCFQVELPLVAAS